MKTLWALLALVACESQGIPSSGTTTSSLTAIPTVIQAQAFELVDGNGAIKAKLSVGLDGGAELQLADGDGVVRVVLFAGVPSSGLVVQDTAGTGRVMLGTRWDQPVVGLADEDGQICTEGLVCGAQP